MMTAAQFDRWLLEAVRALVFALVGLGHGSLAVSRLWSAPASQPTTRNDHDALSILSSQSHKKRREKRSVSFKRVIDADKYEQKGTNPKVDENRREEERKKQSGG